MSNPAQTESARLVSEGFQEPGALPFPAPCHLFSLLVCYFVLQIILRTTFSSSTDLDESEAVVLAQGFRWGYGSAPPLYTWLQIPVFAVLGETVLGLSVLKNLLLLSTYLLTYATARVVTRSRIAAMAAALSLLYLPQVAWESQRDLTHSVLSSTMAMGTLFSLLRLLERKRTVDYVLFGLCGGFGMLSKFNYVLWLLGLVLAAVSIRELRPALLDKRMPIALGLACVIFLPTGLWMLNHPDLAMRTSFKFDFNPSLSWFQVIGLGVKNVLQSLAAFTAPISAVYFLIFLKRPKTPLCPTQRELQYCRLMVRAWIIVGVTLVLLILFARATGFKERWFQPILIALPVAAIAFVQNRLDGRRLRAMVAISLAIMAAVAVIMPGRLLMAERLNREEPLTRPYAALTAQARRVIPADSFVICETRILAGNLRLGLHDCTVATPELVSLFGVKRIHGFLAWEANPSEALPESLRAWADGVGANLSHVQPRYFSAQYRYHQTKQRRLGLIQIY
jgi:lipopolysaccharide core galacturonosyltransferase RgtB